MSSVTIRIREADKRILDELGSRYGESAQTIIHQAIEEYRRRRLLETANEAYARLREDAGEWKAELEERDNWDAAIADGAE